MFTPWSNLHKTAMMEVGSIGFHDEKNKLVIKHVEKDRDILRVIAKTKFEDFPNLADVREANICKKKKK